VGDRFYPAAVFERHLFYLTRHFSIVSLDTLLERLAAGRLTDEVALTFDDGLRNNFIHAYPLLKRFNAPATFFVCPGLIENGRWIWTHEVRARLAFLSHTSIESRVEQLKTLALKERNEAEDDLRRKTAGFQPNAAQCQEYDLMNWDELQQLDPALITVGSHSLTHPILSTLTGPELTVEIGKTPGCLA